MTDLTPERALELVELNIRWRNQDEAGTLARAEEVFAVLRSTIEEMAEMRSRVAYAAAIVSGDARWDKAEELAELRAAPQVTTEDARRVVTWAQAYAADDANEWTTEHYDTCAKFRSFAEKG